jgi:competence protein ComEA
VGCATDDGPPRGLTGSERVLLGVPVDLNAATPEDLAGIPGLSAKLAIEVVAERERRGRFTSPDDLIRVRGVGPIRLARARPFLTTRR